MKLPKEKVRLMIDFPDVVALKEWTSLAVLDGTIPADAAVYHTDGLDYKKGMGITPTSTYIMKRKGDRPKKFELDLTVTVTKS